MDNVKGTTARLRRTFQYPTDDGATDSPEAMDEEEQETLIQTLVEENATRNAQFHMTLLALPLLSMIPYLPSMMRHSTFRLSFLGLTSLLSTAYLVHRLPPTETGIPTLDAWLKPAAAPPTDAAVDDSDEYGGPSPPSMAFPSARARKHRRSRSSSFSFDATRRSPIEQYLPYLNLVLCCVLALMGALDTPWSTEWRWSRALLGFLPGAVYAVVLLAKAVMAGVDPEAELLALKYDYKGA